MLRMPMVVLPPQGSRQNPENPAAASASTTLALANEELCGGASRLRTRKFLQGPHSVAPSIVTTQLVQNDSPQSSQAWAWGTEVWLKQKFGSRRSLRRRRTGASSPRDDGDVC